MEKLLFVTRLFFGVLCLFCIPLLVEASRIAWVGSSTSAGRTIKTYGPYGGKQTIFYSGDGCFELMKDEPIKRPADVEKFKLTEYVRENVFGGVGGFLETNQFGSPIFETSFRIRYWVVFVLFSLPPALWLILRFVIPSAKKKHS